MVLVSSCRTQVKEERLREADQKTFDIMLYIAGRKEQDYLTVEDLEKFDCQAFKEIDKLWLDYPKPGTRHFGFSVQKEIWQKNGSPDEKSSVDIWREFYIDIGWKEKESGTKSNEGYLPYQDIGAFTGRFTEDFNKGALPEWFWQENTSIVFGHNLFSRCEEL
ncbi:GUN4-like protein [Xenococcus sp. PCC 7305]|uniref:GUN4 domain-containing protein n=1 Tax=Xenococcus sp. PCC 7305 TaxID=102125 RepID=UPI0002ACEEE4|nr:GUN4 domain-containing protein [Xenococcus sp. PCC 7305]ELS03634.1 GUN4-like protein [Xenococcus sp. PCC 7305]